MLMNTVVHQLKSRMGRFVPRESHADWIPESRWTFVTADGVSVRKVKEEGQSAARRLLLDKFYKEAPFPAALKVTDGTPQISAHVEREIEMYLATGLALEFAREGKVEGVGLFAIWEKREDYDLLEADGLTWLNAAAVLAKDAALSTDPRVTFLELQFQHRYNLFQRVLRKYPDRKAVLWAGPLIYTRALRGSGISDALISNCVGLAQDSGLILCTQITFAPFHATVAGHFKNPSVEDEVAYEDLVMEVDGERVFSPLSRLGTTRFYFDLPARN